MAISKLTVWLYLFSSLFLTACRAKQEMQFRTVHWETYSGSIEKVLYFRNCSRQHVKYLSEAMRDAGEALLQAETALATGDGVRRVQKCFGSGEEEIMQVVVEAIRKMADGFRREEFCFSYNSASNASQKAYINLREEGACIIHIRPIFLEELHRNERAQTILHEISHLFADTRDYKYLGSYQFETLSPQYRAMNADHFVLFFSAYLLEE